MFGLLEGVLSFFQTLVDTIVSLIEFIINVIPFLLETILSLVKAVGYLAQSMTYVTGFSIAVPSAVFSMFITMVSLSIVFFLVGRVK